MKKLILTILATCSFGIQAERHRIFDLLGVASSTYDAFEIQSDEFGARIMGKTSNRGDKVLLYEVVDGQEGDIPASIRDAVVCFNFEQRGLGMRFKQTNLARLSANKILRSFGIGCMGAYVASVENKPRFFGLGYGAVSTSQLIRIGGSRICQSCSDQV